MTDFRTGARRDTGGKGRCDLLPHSALLRVSRQMEGALAEHEERNWEMGSPIHSFLDSAMRHLFKYRDGRTDEDHLAAAATNVLMALWTEDHMPEMQDIPTRPEYGCLRGSPRYLRGLRGRVRARAPAQRPRGPRRGSRWLVGEAGTSPWSTAGSWSRSSGT